MNLSPGKWMILIGMILIIVGILSSLPFKIFPFGKLPGDIQIQKENLRFYFPIVSCLILSILLSLFFVFFRR